jgi:hypothetical protein
MNSKQIANDHKDELQATLEKHQRRLIDAHIWRTCLNCINWYEVPMSGKTYVCQLYKATPPPQVIVHGCRDWDDDIPF